MTQPIVIDLPHSLGTDKAKERMRGGIGKLKDHIPGGSAQVESRWEGDRMFLRVQAMGQEVTGHIDVFPAKVRLELKLPAFLGLFASKIEQLVRSKGNDLLEDKTGKG